MDWLYRIESCTYVDPMPHLGRRTALRPDALPESTGRATVQIWPSNERAEGLGARVSLVASSHGEFVSAGGPGVVRAVHETERSWRATRGALGACLEVGASALTRDIVEETVHEWLQESRIPVGTLELVLASYPAPGESLSHEDRLARYQALYPGTGDALVAWAASLSTTDLRVDSSDTRVEIVPLGAGAPWGLLQLRITTVQADRPAHESGARPVAHRSGSRPQHGPALPGERDDAAPTRGLWEFTVVCDPLGLAGVKRHAQSWLGRMNLRVTSLSRRSVPEVRWLATAGGPMRYWKRLYSSSTDATAS